MRTLVLTLVLGGLVLTTSSSPPSMLGDVVSETASDVATIAAARQPSMTNDEAKAKMEEVASWQRAASTPQRLVLPTYSIAEGRSSRLVLLDTFLDPIEVAITALARDGSRHGLGFFTVEPRSYLELDLGKRLATAGEAFREGSVRVDFFGDNNMLQGWSIQRRGSGVTEILLENRDLEASNLLTSFWDTRPFRREGAVRPAYFLHNADDVALGVSTRIRVGEGDAREASFLLAPGAGTVVRPELSDAAAGWIEIRHDGGAGALVATGLLEGPSFSSTLPVVPPMDEAMTRAWEAVRVPITAHRARALKPETLRPVVTLFNSNLGGGEETATVSVLESKGGRVLAEVQRPLAPGQVDSVDILGALGALGARAIPQEVRLRVEVSGSGLVPWGASIAPSGQPIDIGFFSREDGHGTGQYPVPDLRANEVFTTFVNLSDEPADLAAQLSWEGGAYAIDGIRIPSGGSHRLDFDRLIMSDDEDLLGRTLDPELERGFLQWLVKQGEGDLIARTEVRPREALDSFGFNCSSCCFSVPIGKMIPGNVDFEVGSSATLRPGVKFLTCSGISGPFTLPGAIRSLGSPFTWDGNTVSASSPAQKTASFSGIAMLITAAPGSNCGPSGCPPFELESCVFDIDLVADSSRVRSLRVDIQSASLTQNRVRVSLEPAVGGLSGNLRVVLRNPSNSSMTRTILNENRDAGQHDIGFGALSAYTNGHEYTEVFAEWTVGGTVARDTFNYRFRVLGDYHHTRYNVPTESLCSGSPQNFHWAEGPGCVNIAACNWHTTSGRSGWISEVEENGSGSHSTLGAVSLENFCTEPTPNLAMAVRNVSAPCPSCQGHTLSVGSSVAVQVGHSQLACGDQVFVDSLGVFTVNDSGGGLAHGQSQLDHYVGASGCNRVGGNVVSGTRKTFKLF